MKSRVTRHASHVTRHTSHITTRHVPLGLAILRDLGDGDAEGEGAAGVGGLDLNPEARLLHAYDLRGGGVVWW